MFNSEKEYRINTNNDDWVTPEETLLDSDSRYADLEKPISQDIFRMTLMAMVACFIIVGAFTFKIGIIDHASLAKIAYQNRSVNFSIPPPRGVIFDRLGKPIVKNQPSFDLLVVSREAKENPVELEANISKVASKLKITEEDFNKTVTDSLKTSSVFIAASDLNKDQVLAVKYIDPKGFYIIPNTKRYYPDGHQFSQVIGYVGKVNQDDLLDDYYYSTDIIGKLGVEQEYEEFLRGQHGGIFFSKDESGNSGIDPLAGNNLFLNIDKDLQKETYNELYKVLAGANLSQAAAIIQNPQTGAILSMVSFPTFDNNVFISGLSQYDFKKLFENKAKPLFNRTISGLYNPGSTIKPLMGLMALQENIFTPQDTIRDCISLVVPNPYNKDEPYVFKNWRKDYGLFNLRRAIANSCNVYFFIVGGGYKDIEGLGADRIAKYLKGSLADSKLGIDLPSEEHGFIPTPDWKLQNRGENWYQGDTYNISIGQGDLLVTPLWLNSYVSAIANGGTIYKPEIALKITDSNQNVVKEFSPQALARLPFKQDVLDEVKNDMSETIISGTARLLQDLPVSAGAKTGTSEVIKGKRINSLFTAFAPFDHPEISITVLIEGSASNQGLAIVTANNILKWYFNRNSLVPTEISKTASNSQ